MILAIERNVPQGEGVGVVKYEGGGVNKVREKSLKIRLVDFDL